MRGVFDYSASRLAATLQLLKIRQGSNSVSDYAIDFHILAVTAGWGERELHGAFYYGLADCILEELSTCDLPTSLDGLIDLALRMDSRLTERRVMCRVRDSSHDTPRLHTLIRSQPLGQSPPEPMQLRHAQLSQQECQRRRDNHLCLYCGGAGHLLTSCSLKGAARQ